MKYNKIFAALLAAFAFAGCAKDITPAQEESGDNSTVSGGEKISLTFQADMAVESKTTFGTIDEESAQVKWESGDLITVFVGSKTYKENAIEIDAEDAGKATFGVEIDVPEADDDFIAFYPSAGAALADGGVSFTLDAEQYGAGNGLPKRIGSYQALGAAVAEAGKASSVVAAGGASLLFKNVFAALSFDFPSADIVKVSFKGNDGEDVAGTYVISPDGTLSTPSDAVKEVTMKTSDGQAFKKEYNGVALTYQMLVAPQTFEKGFTLTFTTTDGITFTRTTDKPLELTASEMCYLGSYKKYGITASRKVWSKYNSAWYPATEVTACGNVRNLAMDDDYVYLCHAGGPGIYAVNRADGTFAKALSTTGISDGTHATSDINTIESAAGTKLLVCNLANKTTLKLYAYSSLDAEPVQILSYNTGDMRLGDKFTVDGTWEHGKLYFYDYNKTGKVAVFTISNGTVSAEPESITFDTAPTGNIGGFYKYSDTEYLWAGAGNRMISYDLSGLSATKTDAVTDGSKFSNDIHGVHFFEVGGKRYMSHVGLYENRTSARLNVGELTGATLAAGLPSLSNQWTFYLAGDASSATGASNGNGAGDADIRIIDGVVYIAAVAPGSGVSVVELKCNFK